MDMRLGEIAKLVGGRIEGDPEVRITGLNGIREAGPGEISFVRGSKYSRFIETTRASALLLTEVPAKCTAAVVVVSQPDLAFGQLLQHVAQGLTKHPSGVHPTAVIGREVTLGPNVALDAHVYVGDGASVGADAVIYAGVYIGRECKIGPGTVIYPNVVLREETEVGARCIVHAGAVIGSDGFGFVQVGGAWMKIPQIGRVIIGDDVEIGSNTAIDRATCGVTRIGQGVKIDNLVQIGHNVEIGDHCAIAGATGIAGSAIIGKGVKIAAAVGIAGHIEIGDGATLAGRAGVTKSVEPGKVVSGFPAMDHNIEKRVLVAQQRVPELIRRVRQLERQLEALEKKLHE